MKVYSATELRHKSSEILEASREDVIQITNHNKPTAVVMSWEAYRTLLDSFDALVEPTLNEELRIGIAEFYSHTFRPWEKARKQLGLAGKATNAEITNEALEELAMIQKPLIQSEVANGIERLILHPNLVHDWRYLPGFKMARASRAGYLVVYKVLEEARKVMIIAILRAKDDPLRLMRPFRGR